MADRKLRVFLCHASQDKPIVRELYRRLLAEGWVDPWLDEEKLLPGQDWNLEIEKAVETTDAVLVCLSSASVTKEGYVQREIKRVLDVADEKPEGAIFVVPLRLSACDVPRRLKKWQYTDYFPVQRRESVNKRLITSFRLRARSLEINIESFDASRKDFEAKLQVEEEVENLKHADWFKENEILFLAQINYRDGNLQIALKHYADLIKRGALLQIVLYDLELASKSYPKEAIVWQTLGDAYMKSNRLQESLDCHTKAEELTR